jgi:hypothetical protein
VLDFWRYLSTFDSKMVQGFRERKTMYLSGEVNGIAAFTTSKAMETLFLRGDAKGRRFLGMKWTKAHPSFSALLKLDPGPMNDGNDVHGLLDFRYGSCRCHGYFSAFSDLLRGK